ncbi:MAG: TRAP transporter large permease [Proteobacteria bacterium]|nr:TRAP transporter large permease [Pseudomonadota bacterium]
MDPIAVGILSFVALIAALLLGIPIAVAMATIGMIGFGLISGLEGMMGMLAVIPWSKATHYTFTVVPLFILMGNLIFTARFGEDLYNVARKWVGHLPGGLAVTTILACTGFAAACGSSTASAATMAKIAVPEMDRYQYSRGLSLGSVASAGTLAIMIPPSIAMVLYCSITNQPVGKMLIAGILPGLLMSFSYVMVTILRCRRHPEIGPAAERASWGERFQSVYRVWGVMAISLIVMVGIYSGVFTPTEAGAMGSIGALILGVASGRLNLQRIKDALLDTAKTTGMIFLIVITAFIFSTQFTVSQLPQALARWVIGLGLPPLAIVLAVIAMYIIMGTFMETIPLLFLTVPVVFPMIQSSHVDPLWFGVITILCIEVGMITPPFGITLFATQASIPGSRLGDIIRGMVPFLVADAIILVILLAFPQISLFLPGLMRE